MLVLLAIHNGDAAMALRLVRWIKQLGLDTAHRLVIRAKLWPECWITKT